jgi:hypothetical protein
MLRAWKQPAFKLDFRRKQIAESKVAMFVTFLRVGVEDERTASEYCPNWLALDLGSFLLSLPQRG